MRPPPMINTSRMRWVWRPSSLKNWLMPLGVPAMDTRSPARMRDAPLGINTSSPRSTVHSSMGRPWILEDREARVRPARKSPSCTVKDTSSTRPLAKESMLAAEGKRSSREISTAAVSSGFMSMVMPKSLFRVSRSLTYSVPRTRATV